VRKLDHHDQNHAVAKQPKASDHGQHYPINGQVIIQGRSVVHVSEVSRETRKVDAEIYVLQKLSIFDT